MPQQVLKLGKNGINGNLIRNLTDEGIHQKIPTKYTIAFTKIIKISKNWKIIANFIDSKIMEAAAEASLTGDMRRIWKVRNFKTVLEERKTTKVCKEKGRLGRVKLEDDRRGRGSNMVKRLRVGEEVVKNVEEEVASSFQGFKVVDIIKKYRSDEKIKYERYNESTDGTADKDGSLVYGGQRTWSEIKQKDNLTKLGRKIISLVEQNDILRQYTTLKR
ncbi:hypothetical protein RhiirA4_486946 [Rhizophagus irregularis]|uniref:Uncharacterized protein n=1 Tax=Rhizophagus irregularis TaxID=588596 RepID=A0A2I1HS08_9GLOM|nr:hypothetical protein RhiirA4_486946 [Rhizophagus irregularis]